MAHKKNTSFVRFAWGLTFICAQVRRKEPYRAKRLPLRMVNAASVARMIRENVAMRQTFQVVEDALETNPCLDGPCMELLLRTALPHFYAESGKFPLSFPEARALDDYFFHVGNTHFWRRAYGFPAGGALPQQPHVHAADVGMFTFNLKP